MAVGSVSHKSFYSVLSWKTRGRGCNNLVCWHFALRRWGSKIVEAIADTIFALRGSSEWSVQRSRWGYCSLSLVPSHNRVSWRLLDWYTLYTISLDSSMMYIRQMQILVQAQICTWLIVYTKRPEPAPLPGHSGLFLFTTALFPCALHSILQSGSFPVRFPFRFQ